jgi:hypothetical protein
MTVHPSRHRIERFCLLSGLRAVIGLTGVVRVLLLADRMIHETLSADRMIGNLTRFSRPQG